MITDGYGLIVERRSYDTWGKKRNVLWREDGPLDVLQAEITNRGYTGHEEIVEVGLVHMNGRVNDQELGRFISPDPIIQAAYVTNSFNRYAYAMNNPLKYTDPTGFRAIEGAGISEPGIKDGMGKYDPLRDNGSSSREPSNRKDRDRSTPSTPVKPKPKPKEEEEPKVGPTVEPPSPKNHWGNKDFTGEMDPAVRNEALSDTMNSLTGAEDFVDATETVLDANATVVDKVVAVGAAIFKRTPVGKVAGKVVTKSGNDLAKMSGQHQRCCERKR